MGGSGGMTPQMGGQRPMGGGGASMNGGTMMQAAGQPGMPPRPTMGQAPMSGEQVLCLSANTSSGLEFKIRC